MMEIKHDTTKSVVIFRATGLIRLDEIRQILSQYKQTTDLFSKRSHFLLADMRGMAPLAPDVAAVMGEAVGYGRAHGVVLCAHLSDSGIVRLQAARVARDVTPNDTTTVEVISVDEAYNLFGERRDLLAA